MSALQRYCRVTFGTRPKAIQIEGGTVPSSKTGKLIKGLRISFRIHRTVRVEFNSKELMLYNLSEETRKKLVGSLSILVEAGYRDHYGTIFKGHSRVIDHYREGSDWVTKIQSGDGWLARQRVHYASYPPGATLTKVAEDLAKASGLDMGNLRTMLQNTSRALLKEFKHGYTAQGSALNQLDKLIRSAGMTWSIQEGKIQVLRGTEPVSGIVPLLSEETGLIESPKHIAWKPNWPTYTAFTSLLNHNLRCGQRATLKSTVISGNFTVMKTVHVGDTEGNDWYTECEGV